MAFQRRKLTPEQQQRLREVAAEVRAMLYGPEGYPEWGTKFVEIEGDGLAVGRELSRLVIEQAVQEQAGHVPEGACVVPGPDGGEPEEATPAGKEQRSIETEAGPVSWSEPRTYLRRGRKPFFPSGEGSGAERR